MNIIGTIYFLSFIFIISISGVYQAHISQTLSPIVFLFFSSLFCFIVFSLTCYFKNGGQFIKKALAHKKNIFWINFANFSVWFCYMFAIKYLEPAVAVIIGNASGPILVIIISKILRPHYKIFRIEKIASIGIFLSLLFIIYSTFIGKSAVNSINADTVFLGIILCIFTGIGQVLFSIYSKKLSEDNFEPSEILALRFPLAIIISSFLINSDMLNQLTSSASLMTSVVMLCLFGMVLPIYFYQKSIKLVEPFYISILYMIEPILMFVAQIFDPRLTISFYSYIGVGLICAFSVLSIFGRYHGSKKQIKILV